MAHGADTPEGRALDAFQEESRREGVDFAVPVFDPAPVAEAAANASVQMPGARRAALESQEAPQGGFTVDQIKGVIDAVDAQAAETSAAQDTANTAIDMATDSKAQISDLQAQVSDILARMTALGAGGGDKSPGGAEETDHGPAEAEETVAGRRFEDPEVAATIQYIRDLDEKYKQKTPEQKKAEGISWATQRAEEEQRRAESEDRISQSVLGRKIQAYTTARIKAGVLTKAGREQRKLAEGLRDELDKEISAMADKFAEDHVDSNSEISPEEQKAALQIMYKEQVGNDVQAVFYNQFKNTKKGKFAEWSGAHPYATMGLAAAPMAVLAGMHFIPGMQAIPAASLFALAKAPTAAGGALTGGLFGFRGVRSGLLSFWGATRTDSARFRDRAVIEKSGAVLSKPIQAAFRPMTEKRTKTRADIMESKGPLAAAEFDAQCGIRNAVGAAVVGAAVLGTLFAEAEHLAIAGGEQLFSSGGDHGSVVTPETSHVLSKPNLTAVDSGNGGHTVNDNMSEASALGNLGDHGNIGADGVDYSTVHAGDTVEVNGEPYHIYFTPDQYNPTNDSVATLMSNHGAFGEGVEHIPGIENPTPEQQFEYLLSGVGDSKFTASNFMLETNWHGEGLPSGIQMPPDMTSVAQVQDWMDHMSSTQYATTINSFANYLNDHVAVSRIPLSEYVSHGLMRDASGNVVVSADGLSPRGGEGLLLTWKDGPDAGHSVFNNDYVKAQDGFGLKNPDDVVIRIECSGVTG